MEDYLRDVNNSKEYSTVSDYFKFLEEKFGMKRPIMAERKNIYRDIGKMCSSICDERNIIAEIGNRPRFRSVNKYPEYILAEVIFGEEYKQYFPLYSPYLNRIYPCVPRRIIR